MATPNVSTEQTVKNLVRANAFPGGANSYTGNPLAEINAMATANCFWRLSVTDTSTSFTISGSAGNATGTGASTVATLVSGLAAGPLSGVSFTVAGQLGGAAQLGGGFVDIVLGSGVALALASGTGATATLSGLSISAGNEAIAYPNYVGVPNATPTWVDDATVHFYQVTGQGAVVVNSGLIEQKQVRQIQTNFLETQALQQYYTAYQSNLNQTAQKNTKQQQC